MTYTVKALPLSFKGAASTPNVLNNAKSAPEEILSSLPAESFVVAEGSNFNLFINCCKEPYKGLSVAEAVTKASEIIEQQGGSLLYVSAHASEMYPELHRDEIITLKLGHCDSRGLPVIEMSADFKYTG